MPELPEVEHLRREIHALTRGRTITSSWTQPSPRWCDLNATTSMRTQGTRRRGKYLIWDLQHPDHGPHTALLHLGMTGHLGPALPGEPRGPHTRAELTFDDGTILRLHDPRGFGSAHLAHAADLAKQRWAQGTYARLGPDPLTQDWDPHQAAEQLAQASRGRDIKAALLDQQAIAGVGNYIADESLHRAGIHPRARALTPDQSQRLVDAVVEVMADSLAAGGLSERDYLHADRTAGTFATQLRVRGRGGQPCHACGTTLVKAVVAGRGTTWCPHCQPARSLGTAHE